MYNHFKEALKNRRTFYQLENTSPISDEKIEEILSEAITHVPSAFNSQSSRVVLLLGDNHKKVWDITKGELKKRISPEAFVNTEKKIDGSFASGYGTILFFEDTDVVKGLQEAFPSYSDRFPVWSQQTSAMHQLAVWSMLVAEGLGVSLQHYNPLIDDEVKKTWNIPASWELVAQMPFGSPIGQPGEKEVKPLEERILIFK